MAFTCDECGHVSTDVQYGGAIQTKGSKFTLEADRPQVEKTTYQVEYSIFILQDTGRQVVKSDFATIIIPELEFEIPPSTRKGTLSTIQGFLINAAEALSENQEDRRVNQILFTKF